MDVLTEEGKKLFRVRRTVMEMLRDRGYPVLDSDIHMTPNEFARKFGTNPKRQEFIFGKERGSDDKVVVLFPEEEKLGMATIKGYYRSMEDQKVTRAIVVVKKGISAVAKQNILNNKTKVMEIFNEDELMINVSKHVLVPKHEVLTELEKKTLLNRYTLKETQLPRIQKSDAMARYLGLTRGQVLKIIRPSETAGRYVTYRCVI